MAIDPATSHCYTPKSANRISLPHQQRREHPKMPLSRFTGKIAEDQDWLNREYTQLYRRKPSPKDIMLARNRRKTVIFDGLHWRELDFVGLKIAMTEKEISIADRLKSGC
jgi:hypothetical protein